MKRFSGLILICFFMTACIPDVQPSDIPHERYTEVVRTVVVQLTNNAKLTPSVTSTNTPEPTATNTMTPEPSPTFPSPTPTWFYHDHGEVQAPILLYYHIADSPDDNPDYEPGSQDNISTDTFRQQIYTLRENGYMAIPISLLINTIFYGADLPEKPIVITFDSTTEGIFNKAFPIMEEFHYVGNIFITVNDIDKEGMLSVDQIQELIDAGWDVGSSGMNGYNLTADYEVLSDEISNSRIQLEALIDQPVTVFAYPYGNTDDVILNRVSSWGYIAAVGHTWYQNSKHNSQNIFYLSRFEVLNGQTLAEIFADLPWQLEYLPTTIPTPESGQ